MFIESSPLMFQCLKSFNVSERDVMEPLEPRTQQCWACPCDVSEVIKWVELKAQAISTISLARGMLRKTKAVSKSCVVVHVLMYLMSFGYRASRHQGTIQDTAAQSTC